MEFTFKGLPQLLKRFPDDATARHHFEAERWNGVPTCPYCGCDKYYRLNTGKHYKCGNKACHKKYTVTVGTIFESSHIPLNIWFAAMYLIGSHKKGISSYQIAKDLNVTQKTAWFMLHRIREMYREKKHEKLTGTVEADETYMARKFHSEQKPTGFDFTPSWPNIRDKGCVFGMIQRKGKIIVKVFTSNKGEHIKAAIKQHVEKHTTLYTDESHIYKKDLREYYRGAVTHSRKEYVRGDVHTNNVENFWSIMKRGVYGTYHQISFKHLSRYCDEFCFRYNSRKIADNERFSVSLLQPQGRLKYRQLIANEPQKAYPDKEEN